jgi:hypothetical protein
MNSRNFVTLPNVLTGSINILEHLEMMTMKMMVMMLLMMMLLMIMMMIFALSGVTL